MDGCVDLLTLVIGVVLVWLLVIERVPEAFPIAVGAKFIVKVTLCPASNVNGSDGPLRLNPLPDAVAWVTVERAVPEFVSRKV